MDSERQLPIWIGPCEADAITIELQDVKVARPLTQDLLKNVITELGGTLSHVLIKELNEDGVTIVMVSHDIHCVTKNSNRVLHLGYDYFYFGTTQEYMDSQLVASYLPDRGAV